MSTKNSQPCNIQRIIVFEQNNRAQKKISGIRDYGGDCFEIVVEKITNDLPPIIDDGRAYLPQLIDGDLVLDYLMHPDLSYDLARLCSGQSVAMVASGKKITIEETFTPPVCCALPFHQRLGLYGQRFGMPKFSVVVEKDIVTSISVKRGAPCGATWRAAPCAIGLPLEQAAHRIGLETQFFCSADPSGWDPIHGKSPVHLAGHLHRTAFLRDASKN